MIKSTYDYFVSFMCFLILNLLQSAFNLDYLLTPFFINSIIRCRKKPKSPLFWDLNCGKFKFYFLKMKFFPSKFSMAFNIKESTVTLFKINVELIIHSF